MWFGYNYKNIFCHFFYIVNLDIFHPQYIDSGYLFYMQLLFVLIFLHMFSSWYEDVHVVWI